MNKSLTATLKYALASDKKMTLMAKLVQGKKVEDALSILQFLPKKAAKILLKVIKSAFSNAKNASETKDFFIKEIKVGAGPKIKRVRFTSRSRISHYEKSRSFVQVILEASKGVKEVKASAKDGTGSKEVKEVKAPKADKPVKKTVTKKVKKAE